MVFSVLLALIICVCSVVITSIILILLQISSLSSLRFPILEIDIIADAVDYALEFNKQEPDQESTQEPAVIQEPYLLELGQKIPGAQLQMRSLLRNIFTPMLTVSNGQIIFVDYLGYSTVLSENQDVQHLLHLIC